MVAFLVACGGDEGSTSQARESKPAALVTSPAIVPGFTWKQSDYAVRCGNRAVAVAIDAPDGWRASIGSRKARGGTFELTQRLRSGKAFQVTFTKGGSKARKYFIRCLPEAFPRYRFERIRPGGPRLIMVEMGRYAVAFDRGGVPVWWYLASGDVNNARFMGDGTFTYV